MVHQDDPGLVVQVIRDFVDRIRGDGQ